MTAFCTPYMVGTIEWE